MTPASLEHGRLAAEGQAKFTDKGQFRGRTGGRETQRELEQKEGEKLKTRSFTLLQHDEISQDISN